MAPLSLWNSRLLTGLQELLEIFHVSFPKQQGTYLYAKLLLDTAASSQDYHLCKQKEFSHLFIRGRM